MLLKFPRQKYPARILLIIEATRPAAEVVDEGTLINEIEENLLVLRGVFYAAVVVHMCNGMGRGAGRENDARVLGCEFLLVCFDQRRPKHGSSICEDIA